METHLDKRIDRLVDVILDQRKILVTLYTELQRQKQQIKKLTQEKK